METHDDSTLAETAIPVPTDEADPIALAPNAWSDGDLGVQLYTHLEVTLQLGFRNGERLRGR